MNRLFVRPLNKIIKERLENPRQFIQVVMGPRQVGKTTSINQVIKSLKLPFHYASADKATLETQSWIEQQWNIARSKALPKKGVILVLDEVQKVSDWSSVVKGLWDEDSIKGTNLKVVILGSSPLLMQSGLSESLAGRFELIPATHWFYSECKKYFNWDVDTYIYYGGYPGAATLIDDEYRWANYVQDSLIETSISRDILLMTRVDKPALLRQLFYLSCEYSSQIVSYEKLVGQLQGAGNTTTLSHYLRLLAGSGLVIGLEKYSGSKIKRRASSPKLQVFNTGLISALENPTLTELKNNPEQWGRRVESAVGAHLLNLSLIHRFNVYYWRKKDQEVDFVVEAGNKLVAIEVKSGRGTNTKGMTAFSKTYKPTKTLLIGDNGIPVADFFLLKLEDWL